MENVSPLDSDINKSSSSDLTIFGDTIPPYDSSKSIDEEDLKTPTTTEPKPKIPLDWEFNCDFPNGEAAWLSLDTNMWSRYRKNDTEQGLKVYYRCNRVKLRGPQCAAAIYHLFKNDSDIVLEYRTKCNHTHDDIVESKEAKLKLEVEVEKLLKLNVKPKKIMQHLSQSDDIMLPTFAQLTVLIAKIRKRIFGPVTISMSELSSWLMEHKAIPDDIHQPFILREEVNSECEEPYFRFIVTTKHLLSLTKLRNFSHSDTTYKCIWQGFPVFMIGTTDWDKAYHAYGLCVCSEEKTADFQFIFQGIKDGAQNVLNFKMEQKTIVCDAAFAIINAFKNVFGDDVTDVMCWFHAKVAMEDHLKIVSKENQKEILEDIEFLHIACTPKIFDNAAALFMRKWKHKEPEYCEYFQSQWLVQHRNWFLGAAEFTPCQNNALESSNRYLKDSNTIRIRHPLPHFLKVAMETVGKWSKDYTIDLRRFATRPSITLPLWTKSYNWARANIPTKIINDDKLSVTVEIQAEVVQSKKRAAKDAGIVSHSSSFQISNFESKKRMLDKNSNATAKSQTPKRANQRKYALPKSFSQSSSSTAAALESFSQPSANGTGFVSGSAAATSVPESMSQPSSSTVALAVASIPQRSADGAGAVPVSLSQPMKATRRVNQRKCKTSLGVPESFTQLSSSTIGSESFSQSSSTAAALESFSQPSANGTGFVSGSAAATSVPESMSQPSSSTVALAVASIPQRSANGAGAVPASLSQTTKDVENFEAYKRSFCKWTATIVRNENSLYLSKCNCPAFLKDYICKHIVGLCIRLKLVQVPSEAKTVPIGQKRKRGRPSKTRPALMIQ